jgi:hypothetical protein
MKSKLRQRTVRERACSPKIISCWGVAAGLMLQIRKGGEDEIKEHEDLYS